LFTHGAVPTAADALRVTSDQSLSTPTQAVGGLFVAKGATLTLHGAGPFEFDVSDHVFIAGSIVSDHDGVTLTIKPTASGLDATLVGTIDLHGSPSANGGAGGSLSVGTLAAKFSHAVIYGSVALRSGDAVSDPGVSGGTLQAYAGDIFMAADVDAHSGSGVQSGGTITLAADNSATVREGGIIASGGASSHVPGQGGTFTATAAGAFTSTASVLITLRGGTATSSGAGGSGGVCGLASDASGSASTSLSSPTIVASGGDSSSGAAGNGGSVTIATGNSAANADAITVVGGIDVTGAHGGTVLVAAYDQGSTIAINGPLLAHGVSAGGAVALTGTVLPAHGSAYALPLNASVTIDADVSADGGSGVVDFNVATLSYTAGAISALGTGGQCITRTGTAVGGTVGTNVLDGDGAGTYGDLGVVDTRP
jgi:filamentous hemagglutinin